MELKVYDKNLKEVDKLNLTVKVSDGNPQHNLYLVDKYQKAYLRQGTSSTKTRSEVSGGGAKPYKQKGTGRARRGTQRSPLMPGGGIVFGPKPRDYSFSLNKKLFKVVFNHVLDVQKLKISVIRLKEDDLKKTRDAEKLFLKDVKKALLITNPQELNLHRVTNNLNSLEVCTTSFIPVETFLNSDAVYFTEQAVKEIEEKYLS